MHSTVQNKIVQKIMLNIKSEYKKEKKLFCFVLLFSIDLHSVAIQFYFHFFIRALSSKTLHHLQSRSRPTVFSCPSWAQLTLPMPSSLA